MQDTAASAAYPGYVPQFDYNPQPRGYEDMSQGYQAQAAANAWDTMRHTARTNESEIVNSNTNARYLAAAGIGYGAQYGAGKAVNWMGQAGNALSRSGNSKARLLGNVLTKGQGVFRAAQAGLGNVSRGVANKWGLTQKAQSLGDAAAYVAAHKPGWRAAAARLPMHLWPDPSVPYAAHFGNSRLGRSAAWLANSQFAKLPINMKVTVPTALVASAGIDYGLSRATGTDTEDPKNLLGYISQLPTFGVDGIPADGADKWLAQKRDREVAAGLTKDYDNAEFQRLYGNNLHDLRLEKRKEESDRRAAQSLIGLLLGGVMGGIPGAGAGAGLPYAMNQLSNKYPTQYAPWSGYADEQGHLIPGEGGNIQVGGDTFDILRQIGNTTRKAQ